MGENYKKFPRSAKSGTYYVDTEKCFYTTYSSRDSKRGKVSYMKCTDNQCKSRGKIEDSVFSRTDTNCHEHGSHESKVDLKQTYAKLKESVKEDHRPIKRIHQDLTRELDRDTNAELNWTNVRRNLSRARQQKMPKCSSIEEMEILLEDEDGLIFKKFGTLKGTRYYQGAVGGNLIFANLILIEALPENFDIFLDGTFSILPFHARQLLVILAEIQAKPRPIAFVLMRRQQMEDYKAIFIFLRDAIFCFDGNERTPRLAMSDFEMAIRGALTEVWTEVKKIGCNFHFCQALHKNAGYQITGNWLNNYVLVMFMRLSLLPIQKVEAGLEALETFLTRNNLSQIFNEFVTYFKLTWLGRYKKEDWNVSEFKRRTNNNTEGFNSKIKKIIPLNPTPWVFLEGLVDLAVEAISSFDYDRLHNVAPPADRSNLSGRLQVALLKLERGEYDELMFLKYMAKKSGENN